MQDNISKIAELTDKLPELDELEVSLGGPVVQFKSVSQDGPSAIGFGVHRDSAIALMRMYMPKGSIIDDHQHSEQNEWIGVIDGEIEIEYLNNGDKVVLSNNDVAHIPAGIPHTQRAIKDSWCWGITMPPAAGYPNSSILPGMLFGWS